MTTPSATSAPPPRAAHGPSIWKELTINRNADAQDEAFAIGPDGFVWSYLLDANQGAAGRLVSTGLTATHFALINPENGPRVLVAVDNNKLCFMQESLELGQFWRCAQAVTFTGLKDAQTISELHSITVNGHALIGVLAVHHTPSGLDAYRFWVAKWTGQNLQFRSSPVALDGTDPLGNQFLLHRQSPGQTLQ